MNISNSTQVSYRPQISSTVTNNQKIHNAVKHEVELKSLSDRENFLEFGRMQLMPARFDEWESKGLEISDEALEAAANAGIAAIKKLYDSGSMAGGSITINAHKIIMDNQATPGWLDAEYQAELDLLPKSTKAAFEAGNYAHITVVEPSAANALKAYGDVSRY